MLAAGFEPAKHDAGDLKSPPFDQLGHASIYLSPTGLEPVTSRLEGVRAVRLRHEDLQLFTRGFYYINNANVKS